MLNISHKILSLIKYDVMQMIDKSKWLEDEEEWLIPTLRIKSVDYNGTYLDYLKYFGFFLI